MDSSRNGYTLFIREPKQIWHGNDESELLRRAVRFAQRRTRRRKILHVHTNSISEFCQILATAEARIAAVIVIPDDRELRYKMFLREVRELASAEGAVLIWRAVGAPIERDTAPQTEFFGIRPDMVLWRELIG